jgi:hypothetical protein
MSFVVIFSCVWSFNPNPNLFKTSHAVFEVSDDLVRTTIRECPSLSKFLKKETSSEFSPVAGVGGRHRV